jgi:hypothetical protein
MVWYGVDAFESVGGANATLGEQAIQELKSNWNRKSHV